MMLVDKQPHQFRDGNRRVRIVKLDGVYGTGSAITVDSSSINATAASTTNAPVVSYGIFVTGKSNIVLRGAQSSVTANSTATGDDSVTALAYGIEADGSSTLIMRDGAVKATVSSTGASTLTSYGIKLESSSANIFGGTIGGSSDSYQAAAFGLYIDKGSILNISNAAITARRQRFSKRNLC